MADSTESVGEVHHYNANEEVMVMDVDIDDDEIDNYDSITS